MVGFPGGSVVMSPPANAGDRKWGFNAWIWQADSGEGHGNPLQYPCLGNTMDRGAWQAAVHGVTKSQTRLSDTARQLKHTHQNINGHFLWVVEI